MKREAIASGDQPFGAVVVMGDTIVGYGPSRVVVDRNPNAHAERVALWGAQRRLDTSDLSGAIIYSTTRPCSICENALAHSNIERMFFGAEAIDAGKPGRSLASKAIISRHRLHYEMSAYDPKRTFCVTRITCGNLQTVLHYSLAGALDTNEPWLFTIQLIQARNLGAVVLPHSVRRKNITKKRPTNHPSYR